MKLHQIYHNYVYNPEKKRFNCILLQHNISTGQSHKQWTGNQNILLAIVYVISKLLVSGIGLTYVEVENSVYDCVLFSWKENVFGEVIKTSFFCIHHLQFPEHENKGSKRK